VLSALYPHEAAAWRPTAQNREAADL